MEATEVLTEIRSFVEDEWASNSRPVLLSSLPTRLERKLGSAYKIILADKGLKAFLQKNSEAAGVRLIQDPVHHARVGVIPRDREYAFPTPASPSSQITAADARAFAKVLDMMTAEEQRAVALPASFVARLLNAK